MIKVYTHLTPKFYEDIYGYKFIYINKHTKPGTLRQLLRVAFENCWGSRIQELNQTKHMHYQNTFFIIHKI